MSSADVKAGKILFLKNVITEEDLSSQIDGIATEFTLLNNFVSGTVKLWLNGLKENKGVGQSYVELSPNKIQFNVAPQVGDDLDTDYIKK